MANDVINEIIFRNVDQDARNRILEKVRNADGEIDFEILLPRPLNIWCGDVSSKHNKAFPGTGLDWSTTNWGTKWNAYGLDKEYKSIEEGDDSLTLRFQTAWSPPMGWIVALFNFFKLPFEHNYLTEGSDRGVSANFDFAALSWFRSGYYREAWSERPADDELQKHIHKMLWGVESLPRRTGAPLPPRADRGDGSPDCGGCSC
jgi:hypothetical protein